MTEYDRIFQENEHKIQKQTEELKMYDVQLQQLKAECVKLRTVAESVKEKE